MKTTETTTGRALSNAREHRGLSLSKASEEMGISASLLEAFEGWKPNWTPIPKYAQGDLTRYAKYLGIDHQKSSEEFERGIVEAVEVRRSYRTEEITVNALDDVT
ncbi:MAG: helix-turn-helix domain-containing protein, partial [Rubrobacteraceae bacterium]